MAPAYTSYSTAVATLGSTVVTTGNKKKAFIKYLKNTCKLVLLVCWLFFCTAATAQKVFPVTKSALSGISIPEGSKQDKRMLMVSAAQLLLEMEAKDFGATIQNTEVLYLPLVAGNNYNLETFTASATQAGWQLSPVEGTKEYFWLQQGQRVLMCYLAIQKKEINLYLADANGLNPQNNTTNPPIIDSTIHNTNHPLHDDSANNNNNNHPPPPVVNNITNPVVAGNYQFSTTNFDDGWTSTIHEDWVEVAKGNIKLLLHYPKEGTIFPADPDKLTTAAWNILVAPRYSQLKNYKTAYVEIHSRPYFGLGTATENNSGNTVFVVLFRRGAGWMEIVSPEAQTFTREFGFNPETIRWAKISDYSGGYVVDNYQGAVISADEADIYNKLDNMFGRNKFAVAASDLDNTGRWKANYASNTFYYNYYTGSSAGMSTFSSSEWYEFSSDNKYHWEAVMTNSGGGFMDAAQSKSDGAFKSLNNWQLYFSNIGGKEKTFDVYFSAIKGGRVLWVNDAKYPGSGIFTGLSPAK